jgi:hypothetical protein
VNGDDDGSWHDQQPVIVAAGVAGLVLLALLVWAVIKHRTQVVAATRTRGHAAVVGHVVDLHDQLDIEHELWGAQRANQPGQSGCDGVAAVDAGRGPR